MIGTDAADDLAIVKTDADASELHPATVGDSGAVKIGNVVAAIGNPFGLDGSFSTGVVSGLDRTLSAGGGPHYVVDPDTGNILARRYEQ